MISINWNNFDSLIDDNDFKVFINENFDQKNCLATVEKWINLEEIGFYNLINDSQLLSSVIDAEKRFNHCDTFVLVGIGGSSLGVQTIVEALSHLKNNKRFFCLDNVDPHYTSSILKQLDPRKTVVNIVSKSGGTSETLFNFFAIWKHFKSVLADKTSEQFIFTTDPKIGLLNEIALKEKIICLRIPANVGGRFSVLSPVGLFPAAFLGLNPESFLKGAREIQQTILNNDLNKNETLKYALYLFYAATKLNKNIVAMMPYSNQLAQVGNWFKQLWAESLGKAISLDKKTIAVGQTPVACVGANDQHACVQLFMEGPNDKVVTFIKIKNFKSDIVVNNPFSYLKDMEIYENVAFSTLLNFEQQATAFALKEQKRLNVTLEIDVLDEFHIGELLYFFECATAFSGILYNINAFDQPGVEAGKIATRALLGDPKLELIKKKIVN
jgi:glucose-6-phosphate isomerase